MRRRLVGLEEVGGEFRNQASTRSREHVALEDDMHGGMAKVDRNAWDGVAGAGTNTAISRKYQSVR